MKELAKEQRGWISAKSSNALWHRWMGYAMPCSEPNGLWVYRPFCGARIYDPYKIIGEALPDYYVVCSRCEKAAHK